MTSRIPCVGIEDTSTLRPIRTAQVGTNVPTCGRARANTEWPET